jgi:hypothetical protein
VNAIPTPVRRLLHAIGINRAVAYALMGQGATMTIQPITFVLIATYLTIEQQAYFYVFGSIIALQMFFDLGLGMATLQFTSHEAGHLTWSADGILVGDPVAKSRLASVLRLSMIWYAVIAGVLTVTVGPIGWVYFLHRDKGGVAWQAGWVWTVIVTAAALVTVPLVQFLCGCGKMAEAMGATALQKVATSLTMCLALIVGGGLLSWPAAQSLGLAIIAGWLIWWWGAAFRDLLRKPGDGPKVSWWREVWPFQWKVALSSLAFYATSQTFSLVLFDDTDAGKAEAARMGASLQIMNVLISATLVWIGARVPTFGHLVARRDWAELDRVFGRVFLQSAVVAAATGAAVWGLFFALWAAGYELGGRVLPPFPLGLLLANVVVQTMVHALSSYLRAHKMDPFLWLFVALGVVMLIALLTFGRAYGSVGMAAALLTLNATICLGGGAVVFVRCRRAWHADPIAPLPPRPA